MAKVSVYIDDATWKRFREQVFERHGTLRRLSDEIGGIIASEDVERMVVSGAKKIGISIDRDASPSAIKKTRPKLRGPVAEAILRQMRDRHYAERVPRQ